MTTIDVPLTLDQIDALLVGTDADRLADARRMLRAAQVHARLSAAVIEARGAAPERRRGRGDRRQGGSVHVAQMVG